MDPKRHLSLYFILTFSSLSSFLSQKSDPSLLFFLSQTSLLSPLTLPLLWLKLILCHYHLALSIWISAMETVGVPQPWKRIFLLFLGLGLRLCLGLCAKRQGNGWQRPTSSATTTSGRRSFSSISVLLYIFFSLFCFGSCWFGSLSI